MTQEEMRRATSRQMDQFAQASWARLSVDDRIRAWQQYFDWARALVGVAPGRPYCPPGHVPAGLRALPSGDR